MGEDVGKGCRSVIWYKYCVHTYVNGKMLPVETIPGMEEWRDKGEWWMELN
jgi:hypothetical protein